MKVKVLCVKSPNSSPAHVNWDERTRMDFNDRAIEELEAGETVDINGDTFHLEDDDAEES